MAKQVCGPGRHVIYNRFMSPEFLHNENNPDLEWNCTHILEDRNHLRVTQDQVQYERIFRYRLSNGLQINGILDDFELDLELGLEYTGTQLVRDPMGWCISNNGWAVGIQLRDLTEYRSLGPYIGLEGCPGRTKLEDARLVGEREEQARIVHWPRHFRITIKPLERIGVCRTPIGDGHLFTAFYDEDNSDFDVTKEMFLDVFRFLKEETYNINFVQVTATVTVR